MILYVRRIKKARWGAESLNTLSGEAITEDWYCLNNEWSVFQFEGSLYNLSKTELLDKIVLRMVADNIKKTKDGVDLLVLDGKFINSIKSIVEPDSDPKLDSYHCNICDISYEKIKKALTYTLKYYDKRIISYSMRDIKDLLSNASEDFLTKYKSYKDKERLKDIKRAFSVDF